jgi:type I restriction enzyme M protein
MEYLRQLEKDALPKKVIHRISEQILSAYTNVGLIDRYDIYQHLMDYWAETMQDDLYELSADGWKAGNEVIRLIRKGKEGKKDREVEGIAGLEGRLIPPSLMIEVYFAKEKAAIDDLEAKKETVAARVEELREEHSSDEGLLAEVTDDKGKISRKNLAARIKDLKKKTSDNEDEWDMLRHYMKLMDEEAELSDKIRQVWKELEIKVIKKYPVLTIDEIKTVVVERKWMASIEKAVTGETDRISQRLAARIKELAERYESTLPQLDTDVDELEQKVRGHLKRMGFSWT